MLDDWYLYPIRIWPKPISENVINCRIEGLKYEFKVISFLEETSHLRRVHASESFTHLFIDPKKIEESVAFEKWLDKGLTISFHTPVVIRLPERVRFTSKDYSLFLALQAYRRDDKRMDAGLVGNRLLSYNLGGTDPVCGKKIGQGDGYSSDEKPKAHLVFEGKSYYFCSGGCLNKFKEDPERYLAKAVRSQRPFNTTTQYSDIAGPPLPYVLVVPGYPDEIREYEREGSIKLESVVDDTGTVREIRAVESDGIPYEKALREALSQWSYTRRKQDNRFVPFSSIINFFFEPTNIQETGIQQEKTIQSQPSASLMMRIADYCGKLENAALYFVCKEKIVEELEPNRQIQNAEAVISDPFEKGPGGAMMVMGAIVGGKNSYTYDYQVIRKETRVTERRILLEENGKAAADDGLYPKTFRFYVNKAIYGPIGLLGRAEQPSYDYSQLEDENIDGRKAYVIDIRPKKPSLIKPTYGKVWIDKNDGSVLKMDVEVESLAGYERISEDYESLGIKPLISIEIVYGFEKNGLRFPSEINLREAYKDPKKGKIKVSEMSVEYSQYKFFTVGTEWKY
jgi:YHS domain-containing protein